MIHKDYILPEVDLSHDEGDPRWHAAQLLPETGAMGSTPLYREDGTIRAYRWNGLEPGHYAEYWRLCVVEQWAETVARFEENPEDVYSAYWYLDSHPVYWKFNLNGRHKDYPDNHVSHLEHDNAWERNSIWIKPGRDEEGLHWSYETGQWDLFPVDHGGGEPFQAHYHDHHLDGHAATYEQAVIVLAGKVWSSYGNDRRIVDES